MRTIYVLIALNCCLYASAKAQTCALPSAQEIFHGNDIRTVISNSGNLYQMGEQNLFQVPFTGPTAPHALFAGGLWLGGFDDVGNLKIAAQTYKYNDRFDYGPGPLTTVGTTDENTCSDWNRIWAVTRNDVQLHIEDYLDDGVIDNPITTIFSWPGKGNAIFEELNGFPMMETDNFGAPYADLNQNQVYEPQLGEYPHPDNVDEAALPSAISWTVFNDNAWLHDISEGEPLQAEVQLTMYAFSCEDQNLLNQTLFTSYRIVNRSLSSIDSVFMGQWLDPDLGCHTDDFVGSYPDGNTFFIYNEDDIDGTVGADCESISGLLETYGKHPPALSVTFLNNAMSSFTYTNSSATGDFPPGTLNPQTGAPSEFYRYMTGTWRDGTPISSQGTGYQIPPSGETKFAFHGDPNDASSWSMTNIDIVHSDRRIIGSTAIPRLNPADAFTVDLAFSYHRDTTRSNIGNVSLMYEQISELQEMYNNAFQDACLVTILPCVQDCVYPGDANKDGKVSPQDYLYTAVGLQVEGPVRMGPIAFTPLPADEWVENTIDGINFKHLDCNGNGTVEVEDLSIIDMNYGLQTTWYTRDTVFQFGNDIQIVPERPEINIGEHFFRVAVNFESPMVDSLYGLAFAFEYDPDLFNSIIPGNNQPLLSEEQGIFRRFSQSGKEEYLSVRTDLQNEVVESIELMEFIFILNSDLVVSDGVDTTVFRITDVKAVMNDGTSLDLYGQEVELLVVDESSAVIEADKQPFRIYPNPSDGELFIEIITPDAISTPISVFDVYGERMYYGSLDQGTLRMDLPAGLYFVVVQSEVPYSTKVVVTN